MHSILRHFSTTLTVKFMSACHPTSLCALGRQVLTTANAIEKAKITQESLSLWKEHTGMEVGSALAMDMPARPQLPILVEAHDIKSHKTGTLHISTSFPEPAVGASLGVYLLHSLAHIELNAIDLSWDSIVRFPSMPREYYGDMVGNIAHHCIIYLIYFQLSIAVDEALHFTLLCERLQANISYYGAFPAHKRLWDDALKTAHDLKARLAVCRVLFFTMPSLSKHMNLFIYI